MLYILTSLVLLVWFTFILQKKELSWHSIVNIYALAGLLVDVPEVIFNLILSFYKFPVHLLSQRTVDNVLGIMMADGIILPLGAIIMSYYCKKARQWKVALAFVLGFIGLELVYVNLKYMTYIHWSIWISAAFYFVGIGLYSHFSPRLVSYNPPLPYWIHIFSVTYFSCCWFGVIFNGLLNMYLWKPGLLHDPFADRVFPETFIGMTLGLISAIIIPRIPTQYRPIILIGLGFIATLFAWYMHTKGILIYNKWSNLLVALRYLIPISLVPIVYDKWETNFLKRLHGKVQALE